MENHIDYLEDIELKATIFGIPVPFWFLSFADSLLPAMAYLNRGFPYQTAGIPLY
jgi:hypothetical protein